MRTCSRCGHGNPDTANFCSSCGSPLADGEERTEALPVVDAPSDADAELAGVVDELGSGMAVLVVRHGPNLGSRYVLDADLTTAGRHPDSDIFLDDITVSRRHAEFVRRGPAFSVRDVGSLNGTYVNRERVEEAALRPGDEVQVGRYRFEFFAGGGDDGDR